MRCEIEFEFGPARLTLEFEYEWHRGEGAEIEAIRYHVGRNRWETLHIDPDFTPAGWDKIMDELETAWNAEQIDRAWDAHQARL